MSLLDWEHWRPLIDTMSKSNESKSWKQQLQCIGGTLSSSTFSTKDVSLTTRKESWNDTECNYSNKFKILEREGEIDKKRKEGDNYFKEEYAAIV